MKRTKEKTLTDKIFGMIACFFFADVAGTIAVLLGVLAIQAIRTVL